MPFFPVTGSKNPIEWDNCVGPDFSQWEGPDEGEQNPPFLKRGKQVKTGGGKAPCLTGMCPKLCLKTCSLPYAKRSPEQQTQLSQLKGRGYFGEISVSTASLQFSSK